MKTASFTPKTVCFGLALVFGLAGLFSSCLNPVGFPIDLRIQVSGEISIDNINSAEIQFINHTKSMDIEKIEIRRLLSDEEDTEPYPLDSRLMGGPHAGTKESILLRPIGTNAIATITTLAYDITITYRKAIPPLPVDESDQAAFTSLYDDPVLSADGEVSIKFGKGQLGDMALLPRGKTIVHFYRTLDGGIEIQIADPTQTQQANMIDYVQNVTVIDNPSNVNLNSIEVSVTSLPAVTVDFSDEVKDIIAGLHLKLADVENAINNVAANTLTAADVIANAILSGTSPYGNNYSLLIIQNWTAKTVSVKLSQTYSFNGSPFQTDWGVYLGEMSSGLRQRYAVLKNGAWDAEARVTGYDPAIPYSNIVVPAQKYLHIYETNSGYASYASEKEFDLNRPDLSSKYKNLYGTIEVRNYSQTRLAGVSFVSREGTNDPFHILDVGPAHGANPGKVMSGLVVPGNYLITIRTHDGRLVFIDHETTIHQNISGATPADNHVDIYDSDIPPVVPATIYYTVSANGGPPAAQSDVAYTTTLLTFTFTSDPGDYIQITKSSGVATLGSLQRQTATTFAMPVTTSVAPMEVLHLSTTTAGIESGTKSVNVYHHHIQTPQPVITTRHFYKNSGVRNTMPLLRHQGHELDWFFEYETATYTDGVETGPRTTTTLNKFGSFDIDESNDTLDSDSDSDYVRFYQTGSWVNPNNSTRYARLRVGTWVSGAYMAKDKPPRTSGEWEFYTGLDFNEDLSALGIEIENMPEADVTRYFLIFSWTVHKPNYLPLTFTIQNADPPTP
jgi:hypothetical protein